jgi:hypothetical protein
VAGPRSGGSAAAERPALVLIVSPIKTAPGRFQARLSSTDELLVGSSRQPFLDAARLLIERGHDPNTAGVMKHAGSGGGFSIAVWISSVALSSKFGASIGEGTNDRKA